MPAQLLVEGNDDRHVVWALCKQHSIPETFTVETPGQEGGVDALLKSIPVRLKMSGLEALGIVVDADQSVQDRWAAICHRLRDAGYVALRSQPDPDGFIVDSPGRPRVGVWLMPDNQLRGMLEDFVSVLIPAGDPLAQRAENCLQEIEREDLCRYPLVHHPKALIHTWLAWQELPGRPMGQAITAHVLDHDKPLAARFVRWLNRLFNPEMCS